MIHVHIHDSLSNEWHTASFEPVHTIDNAEIGFASFIVYNEDGLFKFRLPVIRFKNHEIIQFRDWQAPELSTEQLFIEATCFPHHWESVDGDGCICVNGLPRIFK